MQDIQKGDRVRWISPAVRIGPFGRHIAVRTGDIREVIAEIDGRICIKQPGGSFFGWTDATNVELASLPNYQI